MPSPDRTDLPATNQSEQSVLNLSQDSKYDVIAVEILVENDAENALQRLKVSDLGGGGSSSNYTVKTQTSGATTYVGLAPVGTAEASASWQAMKWDGSRLTYADGNDSFDNVATNLATLTYS